MHLTRHTHGSPAHPSEQPSLLRLPSPRADCVLAGTPFRAALGPSPPRQASSRCAVPAAMPFRAVESVTECNALQKAGREERGVPLSRPMSVTWSRGAQGSRRMSVTWSGGAQGFSGSSHTPGFT